MRCLSAVYDISCDKGSSLTLQSKWRMGNTLSMSHPPFFVSEPNLTPSDKKLGSAARNVCVCFALKKRQLRCGDYGDFGDDGYKVVRYLC